MVGARDGASAEPRAFGQPAIDRQGNRARAGAQHHRHSARRHRRTQPHAPGASGRPAAAALGLRCQRLAEAFHNIVFAQIKISLGLLPVIGDRISNTAITIAGLSVSLGVGVAAVGFLILIHKLEYFLNARIVGTQIRARAWELLVEAAFGLPGLVAAPIYYAYLKGGVGGGEVDLNTSTLGRRGGLKLRSNPFGDLEAGCLAHRRA